MECFASTEVMDFLLCTDPFNYEMVLSSYVEEDTSYRYVDFIPYLKNIHLLYDSLSAARKRVKRRMKQRDCICSTSEGKTFTTILYNTFQNRTLFDFLSSGDVYDLDIFDVDVFTNIHAFDVREVIIAFHNARKLRLQLYNVKESFVSGIANSQLDKI